MIGPFSVLRCNVSSDPIMHQPSVARHMSYVGACWHCAAKRQLYKHSANIVTSNIIRNSKICILYFLTKHLVRFIVKQILRRGRSEEHTSELQSLMRISYAVFCLNKQN